MKILLYLFILHADSLSDWEEVNGEVTRYAVDMVDKGYLFFNDYPSDYSGTYTIRTFTHYANPELGIVI